MQIKLQNTLLEAIKYRFEPLSRFNNSQYWKSYYLPKLVNNDTSREKKYSQIIKKISPSNKVLDIGCGIGFLSKELFNQKLDVDAIDISPQMISAAKKYLSSTNIEPKKLDAINMNEEDKYGTVVAMSVLEHITVDEVKKYALPKIHKALCKDGIFFIHLPVKTPASQFLKAYRKHISKDLPIWAIDDDGDVTHKIWKTTDEYIEMIEKQGFKLINYDFQLVRSNRKPKVLYPLFRFINDKLIFTHENVLIPYDKLTFVEKIIKQIKKSLALTSYIIFIKE